MLAPLVSALIISISVLGMSSVYNIKVLKTTMNQNSQNIKKFAAQEKNILLSLDFYCQANIDKCTSLINSQINIPLNEVLKYSALKEFNSFNVATVKWVVIDQDNKKFIIKNDFMNNDMKNRFKRFNMKLSDISINNYEIDKKFSPKTVLENIKEVKKLELMDLDNDFTGMRDLKKEIVYNFTKQNGKRQDWNSYKNKIKTRLDSLQREI